MTRQQVKEKGFTIIEVVLVLAIAALIFLMVFLALPALQASQRDTARKNDASILASAITSYTGNNRGTFPTTTDQVKQYAKQLSTNTSTLDIKSGGTAAVDDNSTATIYFSSKCDDSAAGKPVAVTAKTQFAIVVKLESGGGVFYCQGS